MANVQLNNAKLSPSSTFISGQEHVDKIGHYLNCSTNPYDLRSAADTILGAAYAMRQNLPDNQPLAIIIAEPHCMPSRLELTHMLASRLMADNQKLTVSFESASNYWSMQAKRYMGKEVPSGLSYRPDVHDTEGQAVLSSFLGFGGFCGAPVSFDNLMAFCYNKKIPTIFSGAARDNVANLDMQDAFTAEMTRHHLDLDDVENLILSRSDPNRMTDCMAIENLAMGNLGVEHAKRHEAQWILPPVGVNHVFGTALHNCSYEESLTVAYREAGAAVLPVFITTQSKGLGLNIIPEAAYHELPHSVVIDGLAEEKYGWEGKVAEKKHIKEQLHRHSGGELEFYDVEAQKEEYRALAHNDANGLIRLYEEEQKRQPPSYTAQPS